MKLDPVFLVAPKVAPRAMPTRRAFLLAGCTFAAGSVVGGACGYSMGVAKAPVAEPAEAGSGGNAPTKLESTGDARLDYWRDIAVNAPLDTLFGKSIDFLSVQMVEYKTDPVLWTGVDRITREVLDNPSRKVDYRVIGVAIQNIQFLKPPEGMKLADRIPKLVVRREEERKRK
ncbi:MAG: hypothetical protein U1E73_10045 [Planctomycetota bacterium]